MTVDEVTRQYGKRVRALSGGLLSTQEQLATLKLDREREKREAERTR